MKVGNSCCVVGVIAALVGTPNVNDRQGTCWNTRIEACHQMPEASIATDK